MQIAEITRHETSRRAGLLHVDSYDVQLDLTRGDKVFRSVSVVTFDCTEPGEACYADLVAETVHEITLNGTPIDPDTACADGRIALPDLAAHNELRVVADCAYTFDAKGMHRATDSADGRVYCYTNFEPADARRVYANFEQPDLKAVFSFHVTAPSHWTVLSNQPTPEPVLMMHGRYRRGDLALPGHAADIHLPDCGSSRRISHGDLDAQIAWPGDPAGPGLQAVPGAVPGGRGHVCRHGAGP